MIDEKAIAERACGEAEAEWLATDIADSTETLGAAIARWAVSLTLEAVAAERTEEP